MAILGVAARRAGGERLGGWSVGDRRTLVCGAAILLLVAGWLSFWMCRFTVDDAFISWRYGRSLVDAGEWNWNPSASPRVEAYTNPLYTFASILPALLGIPAEVFFKALGLALLLTAVGCALALRDLHVLQRLCLAALVAANPVFIVHLYSGLETGSFVLLLALLFGHMYRRGSLGRLGAVAVVLVSLSRPEGMLYGGVALIWNLRNRRTEWRLTAATATVLVSHWTVRAWYFGHLLPNTYYVKAKDVGLEGVGRQLYTTLLPLAVFLVASAFIIKFLTASRRLQEPSEQTDFTPLGQDCVPLIMAAVTCLITLAFYPLSHLVMDVDNRFRWQLVAPVALVVLSRPLRGAKHSDGADPRWVSATLALTGSTVLCFSDHQPGIDPATARAASVLVLVAALILLIRPLPAVLAAGTATLMASVSAIPMTDLLDGFPYRTNLGLAHAQLGHLLAADSSIRGLIGVGDAGVMPYVLRDDQQVIDFDGLADPYLTTPAHSIPESVWAAQGVAAVVISRTPTEGTEILYDDSETTVFTYVTSHHWTFVPGFPFRAGYWLNIYLKPGTGTEFAREVEARRAEVEAAIDPSLSNGWDFARGHVWSFPFLSGP